MPSAVSPIESLGLDQVGCLASLQFAGLPAYHRHWSGSLGGKTISSGEPSYGVASASNPSKVRVAPIDYAIIAWVNLNR